MKIINIILIVILSGNLFPQRKTSSISTDREGNVTWMPCRDRSETCLYAKMTPQQTDYTYAEIIENGFPVQTMHNAGSYHGGPAIHTLVANITGDNRLEIIVTGLAVGPLYAFTSTGSLVPGFPVAPTNGGAAYPVSINSLVVTVNYGGYIASFNGSGQLQWQHTVSNYAATPPSAEFLVSSSLNGIFNEEEDWKVHGYNLSTGAALSGWPFNGTQSQEYHTPAIADIDNDGEVEIVSCSGTGNNTFRVVAINENGTVVTGWTNVTFTGEVDTFPAIGDIDNDGVIEIIVITTGPSPNYYNFVTVLNPNGTVERSWQLSGTMPYGTAPALADMTGDGVPEVIVQTETGLNVTDGFGVSLPGFPKTLTGWSGSSSPIVGEIDGDGFPEIVFTTQQAGSGAIGYFHILNRSGVYLPGFPMQMNTGAGAVPAIADIDLDGHNEVIITGAYWNGITGSYDKVWAFDLDRDSANVTHGAIQWGQFGHDAKHTGKYVNPITGIQTGSGKIPSAFRLFQNYPNPFNSSSKFKVQSSKFGLVRIEVFDILGRLVGVLLNEELEPGTYEVEWDAANFPSGVYCYKLTAGDFTETRKMVLIK
jgi:hypothetical protein